jgi:hypothetical protein
MRGLDKAMRKPNILAHRIAAFLEKRNAGYCESCLIERLSIASRAALRAALESSLLAANVGVCPDCKTRKQVISRRSETIAA